MDVLDKKLDGDSTWLCEHVTADGTPAPATRLSVTQAVEEMRSQSTSPRRAWLRCPECQTHWRVWVDLKIVRPYIDWTPEARGPAPKFNRPPMLDIDWIVSGVCERMPAVCVKQYAQTFPGDDDGLWQFYLSGIKNDIQLESSAGRRPFIVEHDGMKSSSEAWNAHTVSEAVDAVIAYLASQVR